MLNVTAIPALSDNYIWLLRDEATPLVSVVDPGVAEPVLELLRRERWSLGAILITHHHGDHIGGIRELLAAFPEAEVYGPGSEAIGAITRPVSERDRVVLPGSGIALQVMDVPGHTAGHVAYYGEGALFCGDTLFTAGCGRVFDGTMADLAASLERIAALPPETLVYCAHEYTLDNLGFAHWVEPRNQVLLERQAETKALRAEGKPSVPAPLALELETNPFLRTKVPEVVQRVEEHVERSLADSAAVFSALRQWKDREYD